MKFLLLCCCCIMAASAQGGELFRWVDADGKVHYTDQPPPQSAKQVEEKKVWSGAPDTSQMSYGTQQAAKSFPVVLFANDCDPCKVAKAHLNQRGIPYTTRNPETNTADADALKKAAGTLAVPVLVVGKTVSKGYEKDAWDAALDSAGYPRHALPRKPAAAPAAAEPQKPAAPAAPEPPPHPWAK